ncbi:MAG: hypothetical protein SFZ23_08680 [Planctomycetota bacterium]|nr:hypothetical protein [Planctomycetota bacterium]
MPLYDYAILDSDGKPTGRTVELFQKMSEPAATVIDGEPVTRIPQAARVQRQWDTREGTSLALEIDPAHLPNWRRDVPSLEINSRGQAVYRNDAHQRRVYREMLAAKARYADEPPEPPPVPENRTPERPSA